MGMARGESHAERAVEAIVRSVGCSRARAIWALLQTSGDIFRAYALLVQSSGDGGPVPQWPSDVDLALLAGEDVSPSAARRTAEELEARRRFLRALAAGSTQ